MSDFERAVTNPGTGPGGCRCDELRSEVERLDARLEEVRDAGLSAHGRDGRNGKLSETRADLAALRHRLWGIALLVLGSYLATFGKACVEQSRTDARQDTQIEHLQKSVGEVRSDVKDMQRGKVQP